jgi:hypothetical protein
MTFLSGSLKAFRFGLGCFRNVTAAAHVFSIHIY